MILVISEWMIIVPIQLAVFVIFVIIKYFYFKNKTKKIALTLNSIAHDFIESVDIESSNWASLRVAKCDLAIMENQLLVLPYSMFFLKKFKTYFNVFVLYTSLKPTAIISGVTIYKIESVSPSFRGITIRMIGSKNVIKFSAPKAVVSQMMESLQKNKIL